MKQRFSSLDVQVIASELNSVLVGLRVSNIYDLSSRVFLLKLAKPDHRKQLLIDSGFRCHLTEYSRATTGTPSGFVARLRKFLKSRRVTSVSQVGTDRIINFAFSDGLYHLFLEFFASGNIILTDGDYNILGLHRQVPEGPDQEEVKVGLKYTVTNKQNYDGVPELSPERIRQALQKAIEIVAAEPGATSKKKKQADVLRRPLFQRFPEFPPLLLDHAFAVKSFDPGMHPEQIIQHDNLLAELLEVLQEADRIRKELLLGSHHPGYIVAKEDNKSAAVPTMDESPSKPNGVLYMDFHPFRPRQFENKPGFTIIEFDGFNKTVDEYFSSIESQKVESRLTEREETAKKKLESARNDHKKRVGALKEVQELHIRKAEAIGANIFRVQEAIDAVNGLIAQGMDWVEIARLVEIEQDKNNPVAKIIKLPLKLYENTITLLLGEATYDEELEDSGLSSASEDEGFGGDGEEMDTHRPSDFLSIDIDLGLSPWANATVYYDQKKVAAEKEQKTLQSSTKALKNQEKKITQDLKRGLKDEKQVLRPARNPFWFEKFLFFISSDGYLVMGGRDAQQNDILYGRYLKKGDIFVHADLEGATPIIVKNRQGTPDAPIPPGTLSQAGSISIATSVAWESKALMPAWWVQANQVSKTTTSGELLATGGFVIKGEKNYLAPTQLVLGFAVMFQISKESIPNHRKHRLDEHATAEAGSNDALKAKDEDFSLSKEDEDLAAQHIEKENVDEDLEDSTGSENEGDLPKQLTTEPNTTQTSGLDDGIETTEANKGNSESESEEDTEQGGTHNNRTQLADETTTLIEGVTSLTALGSHDRKLEKIEPLESLVSADEPVDDGLSTPPRGNIQSRSSTPSVSRHATKGNSVPQIRGKKGKTKKAAAKYADQDDEDRELALRILGSNAKGNKAAEAAASKAKREADMEAQKQRRRAQHDRAAEMERKRQAKFREAIGAEDAHDEEVAQAEAEDLSWLPALLGSPLPEDELVAAIPVCAPWAALSQYKYRAKLQPGSVKKGKAVKEILGHWLIESGATANPKGGKGKKDHSYDQDSGVDRAALEQMRAREAELLKTWRETEIVNSLPVGKVRIISGVGSGGMGSAKSGKGGGRGEGKDKGKGGGKGGKRK